MIFSKLLFLKQLLKYKFFKIRKPLYAYWFITDRCNLKCSHCYGLFHKNSCEDLSESETDILLKEIVSSGIRRVTLLGGEPLLNPHIDKIIETLYKNNISILILTNGTFIEQHKNIINKIDEFGLSLDGCEATHNKIRGKDNFKEVINSIDFIKKYGKKIVITYTLLKSNTNDIDYILNLVKEKNIYITFNIAHGRINEYKNISVQKADNDNYKETLKKIIEYKKKNYPVFRTLSTLKNMLDWPDYSIDFSDNPPNKNFPACHFGKLAVCISSAGNMYIPAF